MVKTVLPNGMCVLSEFMPSVRSVSLGVWLSAGSRHEEDPDSGITHFVEHMVFKGTERLSAHEIACEIDGLGGHLDAFTSKETTAFTAKVLDERWPRALEIVGEMVQRPSFAEEDIEREKGVVLEELKMDEDNPNYLLGTIFAKSFWKGHGMGRPIIGNQASIRGFHRARLRQFFRDTFRAPRLILAAAGNLEHGDLVREAHERFGELDASAPPLVAPKPAISPDIVLHNKPSLEQVHLALGVGTFSARDPAALRASYSARCWGEASALACSRRFERRRGWPTASTRTSACTPIPDAFRSVRVPASAPCLAYWS